MKCCQIFLAVLSSVHSAVSFATVTFVECPKCEKRISIAESGDEAFVNLSRVDPSEKDAMSVRA